MMITKQIAASIVADRSDDFDQQLVQKRQIRLKTCADVYNYWRNYKRLYKRAPKDGVEFQIEYIDTGLALSEEVRAKAPIALALHGAPGSYNDFTLLIKHLTQQNVRVIAPNFPEYVATVKTKVLFRHSADEKAAYLRDFLGAINVSKIDLLISHSSAIFPSLILLLNANSKAVARQQMNQPMQERRKSRHQDQKFTLKSRSNRDAKDLASMMANVTLANRKTSDQDNEDPETRRASSDSGIEDSDISPESDDSFEGVDVIAKFEQPIEIKAVALLNPAGHRLPKSMKPTWFKCGSCRIYQHKLGRSLFRKLGPAFLTVVGVPVKVDNMDNVMLSATVMRNSKCQRVVKQLKQLSDMKLPTLLVFSENDKLIEKEIFYEMTQFMNLDSKNFDIFNNDGDIELSQSLSRDWIRVMIFKAGGHYAYSNYARTVNRAVSDLLKRVTEKPSFMDYTPAESC